VVFGRALGNLTFEQLQVLPGSRGPLGESPRTGFFRGEFVEVARRVSIFWIRSIRGSFPRRLRCPALNPAIAAVDPTTRFGSIVRSEGEGLP